jgi:hypothetical protein
MKIASVVAKKAFACAKIAQQLNAIAQIAKLRMRHQQKHRLLSYK